jgi:predicted pyridoxine 5'-phosphate oxidase superfamily flavin-nucleotide-binding protein
MSSMYGDDHRELQDRFDSRALADTLEAVTVLPEIDDAAKAFIEGRAFFFLSTVDAEGQPTVSHKGGAPGFVRVVDATTLVFPSYDGNGMYLSMGNIAGQGRIGLLFIDFETPHRVRVHADATLVTEGPLLDSYPGADLVVRATVTQSFINCPRYITKQASSEATHHLPDEQGNVPLAEWKRIDLLQDVLPDRFRGRAEAEGGTIDAEAYQQKVARGET